MILARISAINKINKISFKFAASFQNGTFKKVDHTVVKRVTNPETDQKLTLVATPDSVYRSEGTGSEFINLFVVIHNKKKKEIKLVQVEEASFKHSLYDNKHSIYENNIVDAKKVLHKDFGGKKALASYERKKRTAPNVDILEETLEKQLELIDDTVFGLDIFDQSEQDRRQLQSSIFPDIDLSSGNTVRDVFTARKLVRSTCFRLPLVIIMLFV